MTVTPTETLSTYLEGVTTGEATAQRGKSPKSPVHPNHLYRDSHYLYQVSIRRRKAYPTWAEWLAMVDVMGDKLIKAVWEKK